jgi:hypothetical protein
MAKARPFDGLFASATAVGLPGWLGVYYVRYQDTVGNPLEDELVAVRWTPGGTSEKLERGALSELLLETLVSAPSISADSDVPESLKAKVERGVAGSVGRYRHPSSLFLLAAASMADP